MDQVDEEPRPKVTPWLLTMADTLCARRLHAEFSGAPGTKDPFTRGRARDALVDALRTAHETGSFPDPPEFLEPEERRVIAHALAWYPRLFPEFASEIVEVPVDEPTDLPRRGIRLGGWIDLCVLRGDGRRELRQLALGSPRTPEDPLELPPVRLAVLRLAQQRWVQDESLAIVWVDLLTGITREATARIPEDLDGMGRWLDERLAVVERRAAAPEIDPGRACTTCRFVPRCPAHGVRGSMMTRSGDRLPAVLVLSPTNLDAWHRCRRELGNRVLSVPPSDLEGWTTHGLYLHDLLRFVHERGTCRDEAYLEEVLTMHSADARVRDEVRRHVGKCPLDATSVGHELEWVRANPTPPVFLANARLDAVWIRDGVLEVRDYKTGAKLVDATRDDTRAQLQAWIAAPYANDRGLSLRIRYEHLSAEVDEDPDPWEPDDEDLVRIDNDLRATVAEMRAERDWQGVADASTCVRCRYRSICPDSAAPSEPSWPSVDLEDAVSLDEAGLTPPADAGRSRG